MCEEVPESEAILPLARRGRWWAAPLRFLATIPLVFFEPRRIAATARAEGGLGRALLFAALSGLLLAPSALLGVTVGAIGSLPPVEPMPSVLPAPQANMIAAVAEGLMSDGPTGRERLLGVGAWCLASIPAAVLLVALLVPGFLVAFGGPRAEHHKQALRAAAYLGPVTGLAALPCASFVVLVLRWGHSPPYLPAPVWLYALCGGAFLICAVPVARVALALPDPASRRGHPLLAAVWSALFLCPAVWLATLLAWSPHRFFQLWSPWS